VRVFPRDLERSSGAGRLPARPAARPTM
jgi:hypothetical protein